MKNRKKGELIKDILLVVAAGAVIPAALILPNLPIALTPFLKSFSKKNKARSDNVLRTFQYFEKNKLVEIIEKNGQQILSLTENGRKRILVFDLDKLIIKKPKKWDGYWRIVIFDIPESQKRGRDALRQKLKTMGFYQLQKSCFAHPFECKKEIEFVAEFFGISRYIQLILAREITKDAHLKEYFGIN